MITNIKGLREIIFHWGIIVNLLKILKKRGAIISYSIGNLPFVSSVILFKVEMARDYWINFKFFRSVRFPYGCRVAEQRTREVSVLIGECKLKDLYKLILWEIWTITEYEKGFIAEKSFLAKTEQLMKVIKTNHLEDKNGIDFWIDFDGQRIPLQLKISVFFQRRHIRKYPDIPSIVYKDEYTPEQLLKLLAKICTSYKKSTIEHL